MSAIDAVHGKNQAEYSSDSGFEEQPIKKQKRMYVVCPETCTTNAGKGSKYCYTHDGSALCPITCLTNKGGQKQYCLTHGGSALCPLNCPTNAGQGKKLCYMHGGSALCPITCPTNSGKQKKYCHLHDGSAFCPITCPTNAGKSKARCTSGCPGGGALICIVCKTTIVKKRGNMCRTCAPIATYQARVREARMAATLEGWANKRLIPMYDSWNKTNPTADPAQCGRYRPDFAYEWAEGVLLLEYDEQMHSDRNKRCELVRMAEMYPGYGGRPLFWIRFNPDAFKVAGVTRITTRKTREAVLLRMLQEMVGNADYDHFMTICYICYNKNESTVDNLVQTFKFTDMEAYEAWVNDVAPV